MQPSFFVCYRREDAGYAAALSRALAERHGPDRVFKDITSLPLAHDWRSEVAAAIGRSTHVLVLIGPNWMAGVDQQGLRDGQPDPIVFELVEAGRAGRAVVPVLLAGRRMPPAPRLPAPLRWLASLHSAHIRTESADTDIADLVDRLPQPPRRPPAPPRSTPPPPATGPRRRGGLGAILAALVVVAVVVAVASGAVGSVLDGPGLDGPGPASPGPASPQPASPEPASPEPASPEPGAEPKLTLTPDRGGPGTKVTATATGFSPRVNVHIRFHASIVGEGVTDADGRVEVPFTVSEHYSSERMWTVTAEEEKDPFTSDSAQFTVP